MKWRKACELLVLPIINGNIHAEGKPMTDFFSAVTSYVKIAQEDFSGV